MSQRNGIELAVHEINSLSFLGEGKEINVIFADTGITDDSVRNAMTSLLDQNIAGIIGPTLSAEAFAADPLAQNKGIPVMAISNTVPGITEMGNFIFRCSLPESSVIDGTIKAVSENKIIKKVGILWGEKEAYTIGGYQAFTTAIAKYGLEIQTDRTFGLGDTDFKGQLSSIIASNPDAICVSAFVKEAIIIVQQARELGFTGAIIGGNGFNTSNLIKEAGAAAEGIMVGTAWNRESETPVNTEFIKSYIDLYSSKPDQFAAQAYTSVWLFAKAIASANSINPKAICNALLNIQNYSTPLGEFSFTENREPVHTSAVQIVKDGIFVIFK